MSTQTAFYRSSNKSDNGFDILKKVRWNDDSKLTIFRSWRETHDLAQQIKNETMANLEAFHFVKDLEKVLRPPWCLNFSRRNAFDVCEELQGQLLVSRSSCGSLCQRERFLRNSF